MLTNLAPFRSIVYLGFWVSYAQICDCAYTRAVYTCMSYTYAILMCMHTSRTSLGMTPRHGRGSAGGCSTAAQTGTPSSGAVQQISWAGCIACSPCYLSTKTERPTGTMARKAQMTPADWVDSRKLVKHIHCAAVCSRPPAPHLPAAP